MQRMELSIEFIGAGPFWEMLRLKSPPTLLQNAILIDSGRVLHMQQQQQNTMSL